MVGEGMIAGEAASLCGTIFGSATTNQHRRFRTNEVRVSRRAGASRMAAQNRPMIWAVSRRPERKSRRVRVKITTIRRKFGAKIGAAKGQSYESARQSASAHFGRLRQNFRQIRRRHAGFLWIASGEGRGDFRQLISRFWFGLASVSPGGV